MGCSHIQKGGLILTTVNDVDTTDDDSTNNTSQDESLILLEHLVHFTNRLISENCIVERCSSVAWKEETKRYSDQGGSVGLDHGTKGETMEQDEAIPITKNSSQPPLFGLQKEKWYGVEYYLSPIDPACVDSWKQRSEMTMTTGDEILKSSSSTSFVIVEDECERSSGTTTTSTPSMLRLPCPNRYLPRTLELCADLPEEAKVGPRIDKEIDPPELLIDGGGESGTGNIKGRLWHRLDDRYALLRSYLTQLFPKCRGEECKEFCQR